MKVQKTGELHCLRKNGGHSKLVWIMKVIHVWFLWKLNQLGEKSRICDKQVFEEAVDFMRMEREGRRHRSTKNVVNWAS